MISQTILTQVQQAILEERMRQTYNVIVIDPRKADNIAGIPIPDGLEAYTTTTICTEQHESGNQCIWADFAFLVQGEIRVILESDLLLPGYLFQDSIKFMLGKLWLEARNGKENF